MRAGPGRNRRRPTGWSAGRLARRRCAAADRRLSARRSGGGRSARTRTPAPRNAPVRRAPARPRETGPADGTGSRARPARDRGAGRRPGRAALEHRYDAGIGRPMSGGRTRGSHRRPAAAPPGPAAHGGPVDLRRRSPAGRADPSPLFPAARFGALRTGYRASGPEPPTAISSTAIPSDFERSGYAFGRISRQQFRSRPRIADRQISTGARGQCGETASAHRPNARRVSLNQCPDRSFVRHPARPPARRPTLRSGRRALGAGPDPGSAMPGGGLSGRAGKFSTFSASSPRRTAVSRPEPRLHWAF